MIKKELIKKIKETEETCVLLPPFKGTDYEQSHSKIDKFLWEYIGFSPKELKLIKKLCPWCA